MKTNELREKYLAFFETKGCVRRPSDVLVPRWDPSVLFTPAGMNQFKDHFLGRCKLEFTRATTCQKCLRTGDIDNVGRTAYHHTFFEMLGNFSFGDYFKRDAIHWAWEFLTAKQWLGLDPEKLSTTVYLDDDEAAEIWSKDIKLPPEKIQRLGEDENFWPANAPSQGPDGVCGPCSEIYYHTPFGSVEIWNLVFTQFNRVGEPPNNLRPLPSKNIDTGMGLERTAAVLQGVETNYHIDILRPLVEAAGDVCAVKYEPQSENGRRLRRIADHLRACAFAVHENVIPGANKEKYVIKRLLRRAVLDGRQMGIRQPFLYQLVPTVADLMKVPYPDLLETIPKVQNVIEKEEANFLDTIDAGLDRIERVFAQMKADRRGVVPGAEAFDMYQTFGFPPELFETLAAERNFAFDWPSYQEEMKKHGEISGPAEKVKLFKHDPLEALKKVMKGSEFLGYEATEVKDAKVLAIISGERLCDRMEEVDHEHPVVLVLDKTPFYGEMGGQVGDLGEIAGEHFRFEVTDARIDGGFTLHSGHLREGQIELGASVAARVDERRRQGIRRAHSATHLLHAALRKVLGEHAMQQGSKVDDDILRFDFANPSSVGVEELSKIEIEVNEKITEGLPIGGQTLPIAEARKSGAMMLFGEKYPDVVRMVSIGGPAEAVSKELCGGTHLENTGQIGLFKIAAEESVAAGTRRITALTGLAALESVRKAQTALNKVSSILKVPPDQVVERVEALAKEVRQLKKQAAAGPASEGAGIEQMLVQAVKIGEVKVLIAEVQGDPNHLKQLIDLIRRKADGPGAILFGNAKPEEKKVTLVAAFTKDLVERGFDAVAWVRAASAAIGGSGGGRPDLAQAGGKFPEKLPEAFQAGREALEKMLNS
ncbi:MAG: alanine--tRNA ligase [Pirellulales bacterium]|nr:alanine--tRNA ligase [Pirellulales bacterium]